MHESASDAVRVHTPEPDPQGSPPTKEPPGPHPEPEPEPPEPPEPPIGDPPPFPTELPHAILSVRPAGRQMYGITNPGQLLPRETGPNVLNW